MPEPIKPPVPMIYGQLRLIQKDLLADGIGKNSKNREQNYMYRSLEDVVNAVAPLLVKYSVIITPHTKSIQTGQYTTKNGAVMQRSVVHIDYECICTEDGSKHVVSMTAEGADVNDKATNKANSFAFKYMFGQAFCIPFEGMDADDGDKGKGYGNDKPAEQPKQQTKAPEQKSEQQAQPAQKQANAPAADRADEFKRIQAWANALMVKHGVLDQTKVEPGKFTDEWQDILESPNIGKSVLGLSSGSFKPKFCTVEEAQSVAWMTIHWAWLMCRIASEAGNDEGLDGLEKWVKSNKLLNQRTQSKAMETIKAARLPNVQ